MTTFKLQSINTSPCAKCGEIIDPKMILIMPEEFIKDFMLKLVRHVKFFCDTCIDPARDDVTKHFGKKDETIWLP